MAPKVNHMAHTLPDHTMYPVASMTNSALSRSPDVKTDADLEDITPTLTLTMTATTTTTTVVATITAITVIITAIAQPSIVTVTSVETHSNFAQAAMYPAGSTTELHPSMFHVDTSSHSTKKITTVVNPVVPTEQVPTICQEALITDSPLCSSEEDKSFHEMMNLI